MTLARISHLQSTAAADASDLAVRSPSSQLDVVSTTPAPSFGPSTPPDRSLEALATIAGEKCGLVLFTFEVAHQSEHTECGDKQRRGDPGIHLSYWGKNHNNYKAAYEHVNQQ